MGKFRIYVALYAPYGALGADQRPTEPPQDYHWALLVGPKHWSKEQECTRHRIVTQGPKDWVPTTTTTTTTTDNNNNRSGVVFETAEWTYEQVSVPAGRRHDDIVARVLIANVEDSRAIEACVQRAWPEKTMRVRARGGHQQGQQGQGQGQGQQQQQGEPPPPPRTSRDWVQRAVEALRGPTLWKHERLAEWGAVESCCVEFAGKVGVRGEGREGVPTFDLLEGREVFE